MSQATFKHQPIEQRRRFVRQIVQRVVATYNLKKTSDLAPVVGRTHGAIKNWGSDGRIPLDVMLQCHFDTGVSIDWLMYGAANSMMVDNKAIVLEVHKSLVNAQRYGLIEPLRANSLNQIAKNIAEQLVKLQANTSCQQ